jgi:hypothetical protein
VSSVYFKGITYVNGSWYVKVHASAYSKENHSSMNFNYVYRLDTREFCVEHVNESWFRLKKRVFEDEINGWEIETPGNFFLVANESDANQSPLRPLVVNWTQFPVYFTLSKDNLTKNITLFYINITSTINGFWFPDKVRIVNVMVCKSDTTSNETSTAQTSTTGKRASTDREPLSSPPQYPSCLGKQDNEMDKRKKNQAFLAFSQYSLNLPSKRALTRKSLIHIWVS